MSYRGAVRILLVEDHARMRASLIRGFSEEGIDVRCAGTLTEARAAIASASHDAVVLDRGLPDGDGVALIVELRAARLGMPILVLTARDAIDDRVTALDAGADDYLVKPFIFAELLARLRALARRASGPRWAPLQLVDLTLDDDLGVTFGAKRVTLSPREHALLAYLVRRHGEVVSRVDILRDVFGYAVDPGTNLLDVHLAHLRRKLVDAPIKIETIRGAGFRVDGRSA